MSKNNKVDFFTVNTGGNVVNSTRSSTDERHAAPKVEAATPAFAKASPNVPKYKEEVVPDPKAQKAAIAKNIVVPKKTEDKDEDDESAS